MLYCEDWEKRKMRYLEYWARENHDRPLLSITAPKDNGEQPPASDHTTIKERWMDTEYVIKRANWQMQNTCYVGESFPSFCPDLGPDYFAACYGTELTFGEHTSWAEAWMTDEEVENFQGFKKIYEELYELTTKYQEGSTCWMGVWHPGRWYPVSCDFSCMVSREMYEELIVGEVEQEVLYLDGSIYHLDGPDALKHLDRILQIPKLNGVQWVYGAGNPTASYWIPEIRKIQAAGKCVDIHVEPEELERMLKELPPEGLLYHISARSEQEARDLLKMTER